MYALVAVGFVVIYNVTGILNFAQGEFAMTGAVVAVGLVAAGVPLPLAVAGGIVAAALVGLAVWYGAIRGAHRSSIVVQLIITIGVSIGLRGVALLVFGTTAKPLPPFSAGGAIALGAATVTPQQVWIAAIVGVLMVALYALFERTTLGGALLASALNREAARLMGVDPLRMGAISFALGAALAGVAGVAIAPITLVSYDMGLALGLKGFVAAVLGGIVSVPGAVVGGLTLGVVESVGAGILPSGWRDALAFGILIVVLLVRPQGLFGRNAERV
ncbi:MAG: branched-chain amino acid ABC transporter permease [Candidatus Elarobacter sp.]